MKVSTRIKRNFTPEQISGKPVKMLVDCGRTETAIAGSLEETDSINALFAEKGYTLLPKESPVYNGSEIVLHYTSTTYKDWCNA